VLDEPAEPAEAQGERVDAREEPRELAGHARVDALGGQERVERRHVRRDSAGGRRVALLAPLVHARQDRALHAPLPPSMVEPARR
jgi:hypothetical protein